ncbi:cyclic GMP-AMP synthase DncV-like nucleotidyltransferase [Henriciella marina]|uniref:Cyclic GMP-AMP synthase n=1 Tax=Henriciella marina TaxID=453851 RepID=A0ABT4LT08_9PROT|nr:hypothetical protein [Henriciella marina]MCZ4297504.1 hypothetical protein [Henriciella marina]
MYDFSTQLRNFHDGYVRLSNTQRSDMRDRRQKNLNRLESGLSDLSKPEIVDVINQGGYAQKTMVQPPEGDEDSRYDIDLGVVFEEADAAGPRTTRNWVRDAISKKSTGMKNDPESKPKCVRVVYADGYQCDFPVFRRSASFAGYTYELSAGDDWITSDPASMNKWIEREVAQRSPEAGGGYQLRRIIRYLKYLAKAHAYSSSTKYPGGLLVTAIAIECYRPEDGRDDIALRETLRAVANKSQYSPVYADGIQISDDKDVARLMRLIDKASTLVQRLDELDKDDSDDQKARASWKKVFKHSYFDEPSIETKSAITGAMVGSALERLEAEAKARRAAGPRTSPWCDN